MTASQSPATWRILDLIQWGTEHFRAQEIHNARLETEWLLAHVLDLQRVDLYVQFERQLTKAELATFKEFVQRRKAREPFQYIIGKAPFYGHDFVVNPTVLIPRPESELLIQLLREGPAPATLLDVGTGCGCLAITAALLYPEASVLAIDNSPEALEVAVENARILGAQGVEFRELDILAACPEGLFDAVLCNPPYITTAEAADLPPVVRDHEPADALFDPGDGLTFHRRLAELAGRFLSSKGRLIMEMGGNAHAAAAEQIFEEAGLTVSVHTDLQRDPRAVLGVFNPGKI